MKLVFFGTPEFAVPTLDALHNSDHEILGVVTTPDKKTGRGLKVESSAIKKYSEKYDISIYFLHDEYMNSEIWRDSQHVAINNNTQIYTKDILEILLKEMK